VTSELGRGSPGRPHLRATLTHSNTPCKAARPGLPGAMMAVAADDRSGAGPHRTARYTTASAGWKTTCGAWQSSRAPKGIWSSQCRGLGRVRPGPNWHCPTWSAPERTAGLAARFETFGAGGRAAGPSSQLLEQPLGVLQIGGVKSFGDPTVTQREQVMCLGALALVGPKPRHAGRSA
jgi:hypothetical protein